LAGAALDASRFASSARRGWSRWCAASLPSRSSASKCGRPCSGIRSSSSGTCSIFPSIRLRRNTGWASHRSKRAVGGWRQASPPPRRSCCGGCGCTGVRAHSD